VSYEEYKLTWPRDFGGLCTAKSFKPRKNKIKNRHLNFDFVVYS